MSSLKTRSKLGVQESEVECVSNMKTRGLLLKFKFDISTLVPNKLLKLFLELSWIENLSALIIFLISPNTAEQIGGFMKLVISIVFSECQKEK